LGLLPIEWVISVDFPSDGMLVGGFGRCPGGASRPWRDIMKRLFFHRFASDDYFVGRIGAGIRFCERGSGTGALRNPGNRSRIQVVPADSVPPGTGCTPWAENISVSFPATRLGEETIFLRQTPGSGGRINFDMAGMPRLWPGAKGLAGRKHRLGEPFFQMLRSASAKGGGPMGDPPDRPYADSTRGHAFYAVPARSMESKASHGFCAQGPWPRARHQREGRLQVEIIYHPR
jgi:hypothetical protein